MRKILALTAIFACVFAFASCKDEEEQVFEQPETTRYRLVAMSGAGIDDLPAVINGIMIFGKNNHSVEDSYFSSEANLELGLFDGVVYSPWREVKNVTSMEVVYIVNGKYYGVSGELKKNSDNYIYLSQENELTEEWYLEVKEHYEEHTRY